MSTLSTSVSVHLEFQTAEEAADFFASYQRGKAVPATSAIENRIQGAERMMAEARANHEAGSAGKQKAPQPEKAVPSSSASGAVDRAAVSKLAVNLVTKGKKQEVLDVLTSFGAQAVTGDDAKGKVGLADGDLSAAHAALQAVPV